MQWRSQVRFWALDCRQDVVICNESIHCMSRTQPFGHRILSVEGQVEILRVYLRVRQGRMMTS